MAVASDIIYRAFERIKVKDPDVNSIQTSDATTAIDEMNDMMIALADHNGINLGYTIVSNLTDAITVPDWAQGMMKAKLTLLLADEYGKSVTDSMVAKAQEYCLTVFQPDKATALTVSITERALISFTTRAKMIFATNSA